MSGFEEEFMKVEKEGERVGWMKVCPVLLFIIPSSSSPNILVLVSKGRYNEILTNSGSVSRHSRTPIIEISSPTSSHTSTPTGSTLILPSDISPLSAPHLPLMI